MTLGDLLNPTPETQALLDKMEKAHQEKIAAREAAEDKYWSELSDEIEKHPICGPRR